MFLKSAFEVRGLCFRSSVVELGRQAGTLVLGPAMMPAAGATASSLLIFVSSAPADAFLSRLLICEVSRLHAYSLSEFSS